MAWLPFPSQPAAPRPWWGFALWHLCLRAALGAAGPRPEHLLLCWLHVLLFLFLHSRSSLLSFLLLVLLLPSLPLVSLISGRGQGGLGAFRPSLEVAPEVLHEDGLIVRAALQRLRGLPVEVLRHLPSAGGRQPADEVAEAVAEEGDTVGEVEAHKADAALHYQLCCPLVDRRCLAVHLHDSEGQHLDLLGRRLVFVLVGVLRSAPGGL
mmetsp:Transcript_25413/g.71085  ORF Transcript_25413/g.71085 Transcript_25413/m.71085 type:complete len:209 (+) Transcript_25413:207-833(+)